jgi:hypothetical protein
MGAETEVPPTAPQIPFPLGGDYRTRCGKILVIAGIRPGIEQIGGIGRAHGKYIRIVGP